MHIKLIVMEMILKIWHINKIDENIHIEVFLERFLQAWFKS